MNNWPFDDEFPFRKGSFPNGDFLGPPIEEKNMFFSPDPLNRSDTPQN